MTGLTKKTVRKLLDEVPAWAFGVVMAAWAGAPKKKLLELLGGDETSLELLIEKGVLERTKGGIRLTEAARVRLGFSGKREKDSRVKRALVYYGRKYQETLGVFPVIRWGAWGRAVKDLLRELDGRFPDGLKAWEHAVDAYFLEEDDFVRQEIRFDFWYLVRHINRYLVVAEMMEGRLKAYRGGRVF
ncbi:MAG: hypothetical protein L3J76_01220 [Candidatus Hydrothermae bacterium]|nr:hypothetical protein [Candidatus Hydrothermae bacterium]